MKILYFTEGQTLESRELREQLARIPEVLSEIKKHKGCKLQPLLSFLECGSNYQPWVRLVQRGLLARLRKTGFKYSGLIRREILSDERLEAQLLSMMQSRSQIEFHVIGPGYDNLHLLIKKIQNEYQLDCEVIFSDVIGSDPRLTWFWAELRKSDGRKNRDNSSVDAAYH
jgi:hypothetical protein